VRVAVSWTDSPRLMEPSEPRLCPSCSTWVPIVGGAQKENVPEAKSDRVASTDCEERVSAMNEVKQPSSSLRSDRLIPPSKNSPARKSLEPDLSVNDHGAVSVLELVTPQASSKAGAPVQGTPVATVSRCVPASP